MLSRFAVAIVVVSLVEPVWAGEVKIGMDPLGMFPRQCHVARFVGPKEAVARYEKRQKQRFEKPDPEVIDRLSRHVSVSVTMSAPPERHWCTLNSGRPEKIVLAVKGGVEPVLVIPLTVEEMTLKNLAGGEFAAFDGSAMVPIADVEQLVGREFDFHLVFGDHVFKDKWKKDYAAKVLK
jgi:hypothetical protein